MYNMPIYYINLETSVARRELMESGLSKWPNIIRVNAIDGRKLSFWKIIRAQSPIMTLLRHGRLLRAGEIGTRLSHRSIYLSIIEQHIEVAVVLEDDMVLDVDRLFLLLPHLLHTGTEWDLILLHNHSNLYADKEYFRMVEEVYSGYSLLGLVDEPCSSGAYIITRIGAQKLARLATFDSPSDYWGWFSMRTGLRVFAISPMIAEVDMSFKSDVDAIRARKAPTTEIPWIFRKSRKFIRNKVRRHCRSAIQSYSRDGC